MISLETLVCSVILTVLSGAVAGQQSSYRSPPSGISTALQPLTPTCISGQAGTVTVTGRGAAFATADAADVSLSIAITNDTAAGAREVAAMYASQVLAAVKQINGVQPENVTTTSISVYPETKYSSGDGTSTIIGYTYTNYIDIALGGLTGDLLSTVLDTAVTNGGNNLTISSVAFSLSPELSYNKTVEARTQAATDAQTTAQQYAQGFGVTLGSLLGVVDESSDSTPVQNTNTNSAYDSARAATAASTVASSSDTPIAIGKEQVSAEVSATFTICSKS